MKNIRTLLKVAGGGILLSWLTSSCAGLGVDLDYDDGYYYPYWSPGYNGVIYPPTYVPDIMYPYPSWPSYRPLPPAPPSSGRPEFVNPGLNRPVIRPQAPDGSERPGNWSRPDGNGTQNPPSIPRGESPRGRR